MDRLRKSSGGIVLVVDDQERNIQVVGATLSGAGYEVMAATSGQQALERITARMPDLMLLDVLMPGMDGFEVCRRLRDQFPVVDLPIIFLSAADETEVVVRALQEGGVDYVTKPFKKAELLARVHTHLELKRARDQLQELMAQREVFIEMMAHDLKNPLGGAQFSTQMLVEKGGEIGERALKLATAANDGIARALEFIEGFLEDARSSKADISINPEHIDLSDVVRSAVNRHHQLAARKSISLDCQTPPVEVGASADVEAVGRILDNLISNAIKFSNPGSSVSITLDAENGEIRVRDQGPGITQEDREGLFKSFSRLSAKPTGGEPSSGLGLSIALRFATAMRGEIELDDNYTDGAEFVVRLPPSSR